MFKLKLDYEKQIGTTVTHTHSPMKELMYILFKIGEKVDGRT